ncbi:MAG TPA: VWA domain-containing protein [Candidatus Bathyarchaeia archaeon]|nr:VWA domain-containing protein [Candidatus Bathyarchaeia archaeon]
MKYIKKFAIAILFLSLISACSFGEKTEQQPTTKSEQTPETETPGSSVAPSQEVNVTELTKEQKVEKLKALTPEYMDKIPETAEEFAGMQPGQFAGTLYGDHQEEIEQILQQLPDIENPDSETIDMYFQVLLGLFGEDYPDPNQIIEEIKLASFGNPDVKDPRFAFKQNYNVEIILDASGSMANIVDGKTRMEAAKAAIKEFAESLPKEANVALRVYGHKGSSKESDKVLSCGSSELVYGMQPYSAEKLQQSLDMFKPTGYTPIAYSLKEAKNDLSGLAGEQNTNIIYLVSDGIETCDGNPVEAARELANSNIAPIINVIGFGTDGEGQRQLKEVANAAGGRYVLIQNQNELYQEFKKSEEIARKWFQWKSDNSYNANVNQINRTLDIIKFAQKWRKNSNMESYNINSALIRIQNMKVLSKEVVEELMKRKDIHKQLGIQRADELESFLNSINKKTYQEAVDAINKQFNQEAGGE